MKDFLLRVGVVVRTSHMKISGRREKFAPKNMPHVRHDYSNHLLSALLLPLPSSNLKLPNGVTTADIRAQLLGERGESFGAGEARGGRYCHISAI